MKKSWTILLTLSCSSIALSGSIFASDPTTPASTPAPVVVSAGSSDAIESKAGYTAAIEVLNAVVGETKEEIAKKTAKVESLQAEMKALVDKRDHADAAGAVVTSHPDAVTTAPATSPAPAPEPTTPPASGAAPDSATPTPTPAPDSVTPAADSVTPAADSVTAAADSVTPASGSQESVPAHHGIGVHEAAKDTVSDSTAVHSETSASASPASASAPPLSEEEKKQHDDLMASIRTHGDLNGLKPVVAPDLVEKQKEQLVSLNKDMLPKTSSAATAPSGVPASTSPTSPAPRSSSRKPRSNKRRPNVNNKNQNVGP